MTIENGAGAISNGILLIVAFHENGIEGGNATASGNAVTGTLHQRRQAGKNRGRIAAHRWRLAHRQGNLPLRHGIAGERVHE